MTGHVGAERVERRGRRVPHRRCVIVLRMGLPRHIPRGRPSRGHGPFGDRAFKGALIGCVVLVAIGLLMMLLGGESAKAVGTAFLVLGVLGLTVGGAGLLAERLLQRRPPPPPRVRGSNGRHPYPQDRADMKRHLIGHRRRHGR
jgi:hypothetical protein